jgi:SAM-dependent methyltransferase
MKCNFCLTESDRFRPFGSTIHVLQALRVVGGGFRQNAICPTCGSLDRERAIYSILAEYTDIFRRCATVLHVAPEQCLGKVLRTRPSITYFSIDLGTRAVNVRMDITRMGFCNNTFDSIICNHVLEHVRDDLAALHEIYRVLKPEGWAILQVPIALALDRTYEDPQILSPLDRAKLYGQHDHVRLYGRDYGERLVEVGFRVIVFNPLAALGAEAVSAFSLIPDEDVYLVKKV